MNYQPIDAVLAASYFVTAFASGCVLNDMISNGHDGNVSAALKFIIAASFMFFGMFGLFMNLMGF